MSNKTISISEGKEKCNTPNCREDIQTIIFALNVPCNDLKVYSVY